MTRRNLSENGIYLLLAVTNKKEYLRFKKQISFDRNETVHQLRILSLLVTRCQYYVMVTGYIIIASKRMGCAGYVRSTTEMDESCSRAGSKEDLTCEMSRKH